MVASNDILGYYRLIEKIGAGGMGEVWKAEDTRLGRTVAVKILPPSVAADQEAIARMRREARTAAQINCPQIATIYSFEEIGERMFIVMEFVDGEPLTKLIARGPLPEAEICRIGREVAEALAEAHAKGIIHRDIKPDNIMVSGRRVKVLDFGIAKQIAASIAPNDPTSVLTQAGMIIGTVQYMSPEQALGKTLDPRTDVFSLGIVLYQAATGKLPFKGDTATETITKIVRDEPVEPTSLNRALSPGLAKIIARCLRKSRDQRFATAADLVSALDTQMGRATTAPATNVQTAPRTVITAPKTVVTAVQPKKKSRWVAAAAIVAAVIVAVVVAGSLLRPKPQRKPAPHPATKLNVPPAVAPAATVTVTPEVQPTTTTAAASPPPPAVQPRTEDRGPRTTTTTPDELYAQGLTDLVEGRPGKARQEFQSAVDADPQNAKAHFRLGEIALANHNESGARDQFKAAVANAGRLDDRERKLAHLGLAITNRNWPHARQLAQEINAEHPNDPDLAAFRRDIVSEEQQQRQFRGRRPH